jgi:hypothetical protein
VIGISSSAVWRSLWAALLASFAACGTPLKGELRAGRYFGPSGSWSVAAQATGHLGGWSVDWDASPHAVSSYAVGSYGGPQWCITVDSRPREAGLDLGRVADDLCRVVLAGATLPGGAAPDLVHASRRELAGAPAELRVFAEWDDRIRPSVAGDLFAESRVPLQVHAVIAVERGPALVTFRMTVRPQWSGQGPAPPRNRMVLERNWLELQAWVTSFCWAPTQPDAHGSLE